MHKGFDIPQLRASEEFSLDMSILLFSKDDHNQASLSHIYVCRSSDKRCKILPTKGIFRLY